ncbi:MAG: hypothetical protein PVH54_08555 [Gammaproteobacteria bacterium]|jgi:hypothetical protein
MRKRVIPRETPETPDVDRHRFHLEQLVQAGLTSEEAGHPIEAALGLQAGMPGTGGATQLSA